MRHTRQRTHHAAKQSHAAQSADHRLSRHTGADPHGPATQLAILAVTSFPIPARPPIQPCSCPKAKPDTPRTSLPRRHRHARPGPQPAILAAHQLPHFRTSLLSKPCFPQSEARHAPHFPTTQAQTHTAQPSNPLSSSLTNSPIPAHLSSPSDLYKNPGSRPPPGFFVISGSVRSPSQQRLR